MSQFRRKLLVLCVQSLFLLCKHLLKPGSFLLKLFEGLLELIDFLHRQQNLFFKVSSFLIRQLQLKQMRLILLIGFQACRVRFHLICVRFMRLEIFLMRATLLNGSLDGDLSVM